MGKRVETRKKDKCRVTGALSDVLRLKTARELPGCACSPKGRMASRTAVPGTWRRETFQVQGSAPGSVVSCLDGLHSPCDCISRSSNVDTFYRSGKVVGCLPALEPVDKRVCRKKTDCSCFLKICLAARRLSARGSVGAVLSSRFSKTTQVIWLILPVVICSSQRLSHACRSTGLLKVKPRKAH